METTTYAEVKTDHTDEDENVTYIDAFLTDDENEEGKVIAKVCRDTGKVFFMDNDQRWNPQISEAIVEILKEIEPDVPSSLIKYWRASMTEFTSPILQSK